MMEVIFVAMNGKSYQNPKVGSSDGTVAGTSTPLDLTGSGYNDLRVNAFPVNGVYMVDLCNRNGPPGTVGSGTHFIVPATLPATLPAEQTSLSTIANPYSTVVLSGILYICEFDTANIQ
ncbi:MAG: hypothetical protein LBO66_13920, partial [Deltaproteobacteria bacterium]|nr:hypothetical protein [Deltaproteobacteria bacterium]